MKLFLVLFAIFSTIELSAQQKTNYYDNINEISGQGYTFISKKDKYSDFLIVQNKNNEKSNIPWYYKGTTDHVDYRWAMYAVPEDKMIIYELLREVFTKDELKEFKDYEINYYKSKFPEMDIPIELHLNIQAIVSLTGSIEEVIFSFKNSPPYTNIHPDKLNELEQKIKERIYFNVMDILKDRFEYVKTESFKLDIDNL